MSDSDDKLERLLKARAEIDEELRRHKANITVLFTDVVGSTAYFDHFGDTAGLAMLDRHTTVAMEKVQEFHGTVIKTIGDSVMAEFPEPALAVRAAVEMQRRLVVVNQALPQRERIQLRIGINSGVGFRRGGDVYGDVINLAARITKYSGPAQILVARSIRDAIASEENLRCNWFRDVTLAGKAEKEDVYEVIWTDTAAYERLREAMTAAFVRGDLVSPGLKVEDLEAPAQAAAAAASSGSAEQATVDTLPAGASSIDLGPRYEVRGTLGRGGMGVVYHAVDRETGEAVALKVLRPDVSGDAATIERFKEEVRLARRITHKNVCRIHDFNRSGDTAFISMELVGGESLRSVLRRFGSLSLRKGIEIAQQICAGLREAHAQGVVHRDLKPENVMLDHGGNVKIMDFGIARRAETGPGAGGGLTIVGTPAYMAPEQAAGKPVDHRADIYSLGLILYEVFTGAPAFSGNAVSELLLKQMHEPPVHPREIEPALPAWLEKVILKCLVKDPEKRFQTLDQLEQALLNRPQRRVAETPEAALPMHLARWQRTDWWLLAAAVVAFAVFLGLFDSVYPYSSGKLLVSREQASSRAAAFLKAIGSTRTAGTPRLLLFIDNPRSYVPQVLSLGLQDANRHFSEAWGWFLEAGDSIPGWFELYLAADGKPLLFHLMPTQSAKTELPSEPELRHTATQYVRDLFGGEVSNTAPNIRFVRAPGISPRAFLEWSLPEGAAGIARRFEMGFTPDGLFHAERHLTGSPGPEVAEYKVRRAAKVWLVTKLVPTLIGLLLITVFALRRLYAQNSAPSIFLALCASAAVVALAGITRAFEDMAALPAVAVLAFLLAYAVLRTSENYLALAMPSRLTPWQMLFRERFKARPAGLALLRGCCLGAAYLAAHTATLGIMGRFGMGRFGLAGPDVAWLMIPLLMPVGESSLNLFTVSIAVLATVLTAWCFLAFPAALAWRVRSKAAVAIAAPVGVWLLSTLTLPGASTFQLFPAFQLFPVFLFAGLQGLLFAWILYRFDVLAAMAAMFTIESWLVVYPMFVLLKEVESLNAWLSMLPWFMIATLGLAIYLRPQITAVGRGVREILGSSGG